MVSYCISCGQEEDIYNCIFCKYTEKNCSMHCFEETYSDYSYEPVELLRNGGRTHYVPESTKQEEEIAMQLFNTELNNKIICWDCVVKHKLVIQQYQTLFKKRACENI